MGNFGMSVQLDNPGGKRSQHDASVQGQRGKRKRVLGGVSGVSGVPAGRGRAASCMTAILGPSGPLTAT